MASDEEETTYFRCKYCNQMFTEAEKQAHRETHRNEKAKKYKPGPKSKTRSATRPDDTATMFEEVSSIPEKVTGKRARKATKGRDEPPAKRKSKKQYKAAVVDAWKQATGA